MLALIAGSGNLPRAVAQAQGTAPLVCALEGFLPEGLKPDRVFRLEHLGSLLADLRMQGVRDLCLAGAIRRPHLDPQAVDTLTRPLVARIAQALGQGDDGALRAIMALLEEAGFRIRSVADLAPDLLPPAGVLTRAQPGPDARRDLTRARSVLAAMSDADIGQACVVSGGQVLAMEGVFGTDWMLDTLTARPDGAGGLLYKAPKPAQDLRADMPTIGSATIARLHSAGLSGVVIEQGSVLLLDREAAIAECDRLGCFLWVCEAG